ncbi:porin family protein [Saccharicrinis sp. FJH2]|uniref:porin family protein n=1 Tax=unclassified Saccharicrinis TaxID=2646859 RepID=UPI0035D43479
MKRIISSGVLLVFLISSMVAESPLDLGIKGGITSSTFTIDKVQNIYYGNEKLTYSGSEFIQDASNGLSIGLFARLKMKRLFLQPEANFVVRNGKMNLDVVDTQVNTGTENATVLTAVTQGIQLSTLDIPVLFGIKALDLKVLKLNLFTGPSASIILNEKIDLTPKFNVSTDQTIESKGVSINKPFEDGFDLAQELETANWNWQVGAGLDIANFYVDVRYEYGLNDITKLDFVQKTNMLMFSVGFKFF